MTFAEYEFDDRIQRGISEAGFQTPMPVQHHCFKLLIQDHRDIYAQSQTGTGKTAAFLLGIFQLLVSDDNYKGSKALIVVPTRELAVQIEEEGKNLGQFLDLRLGSVYGGVSYATQLRMLEKGIDILIGTPGRLIDFHKQKKIDFKSFRFLVIDEADRLFDMGFLPDLRKILGKMLPAAERHTMLFSATLNARVGNLAWEYMNNPDEVIIEPEKVVVDTVSQELYHVGKNEKMKLLLGILKRDNPENAIIFTNTRHSAWEVAKRMEVNGYTVQFLMGDLPQSRRLKIVNDVKKGHHKFLVATDVAARGLHIDDLEMVINYDVPLEAESYVHRIGRTARAGNTGKTITMACEEYVYGLSPIEKLMGLRIPVSWLDDSLVIEDKSEGMSFPPHSRYRDIKGRPSGKGRRSKPKKGNNKMKENKGKKSQETQRNRRTAKVQSAVSSVVGRIDDDKPTSKKHRSSRKPSASSGGRAVQSTASMKTAQSIQSLEKPKSGASANERLEYYKKKYGEDFSLNGKQSVGKSSGNKKRKKSRPKPSVPSGKSGKTQKNQATPAATKSQNKPKERKESVPVKKKSLWHRLLGR